VSVWDGISVLVDGTAASPAPGTLKMQFSHDGATIHRSINIAVEDVAATPPRTLGTVARYFRIEYVNASVAHTTLDIQTMTHAGFIRLVSRLDQAVGDDEDVQNVRAFIGGKDVLADEFQNVSVATSTNVAGTYRSLSVASGARPSQLPGRTAVRIVVNHATAPVNVFVPTTGKTLYITDILLAVSNGSGAAPGSLDIYDDAGTATSTLVLPLNIADPGSGGDESISILQLSFAEPLSFVSGVFFNEAAGTLNMAGVLLGYEE